MKYIVLCLLVLLFSSSPLRAPFLFLHPQHFLYFVPSFNGIFIFCWSSLSLHFHRCHIQSWSEENENWLRNFYGSNFLQCTTKCSVCKKTMAMTKLQLYAYLQMNWMRKEFRKYTRQSSHIHFNTRPNILVDLLIFGDRFRTEHCSFDAHGHFVWSNCQSIW